MSVQKSSIEFTGPTPLENNWPQRKRDGSDELELENDVLGYEYGHCDDTDEYCFQRLPENLIEDYTELLAVDGAGNR